MDPELILRDDAIIKTIAKLHQRIADRFPGSGLSQLCSRLLEVSEKSAKRAQGIGESVWWIRICGYLLAVMVITLVSGTIWFTTHSVRFKDETEEAIGWTDLIGSFDAATSGLIVLGATLYFLIGLEIRIKRRRALVAVHELRSLAHVVDMHQLTKDPERMLRRYTQTSHSPAEAMTPLELNRYLDYCAEMLSLIGKVAALYVQRFDDPIAVAAVSEIEELTTGLSRKIWQKIVLLGQIAEFPLGADSEPQIELKISQPDELPPSVKLPITPQQADDSLASDSTDQIPFNTPGIDDG
ncbi:hypothetical protein NHH03_03300 [Stieleria sp. TO1_6]|uniref:hypothetical protein n=1 Tax=Stieleria tagensis TaxID=2956795 RepID=UPI00209B6307|nr:hypothetical protein [Stieleria tagensis]MCO8120750.1 hypothetical protein [Stieleria tagensis]